MKIGSQAVGDGKNKKEREGKEKKRYYKNALKCYISHSCSEGPIGAIFTKFGTGVDLTYIMTCATFGCYRLKGGHSAAVQNLPFSLDFNGWPYIRQALTYCRDAPIQSRDCSFRISILN